MKKLITCSTVYQLLVAINLRMNDVDESNEWDIILTDQSDFSVPVRNLREIQLFRNVMPVNSLEVERKAFRSNFEKKMWLIRQAVTPNYYLKKEFGLDIEEYDAFYTANMADFFSITLFAALKKKNKLLKFYEYEDGISSYVRDDRRFIKETDMGGKLRCLYKLFSTPILCGEQEESMLLYFPEYYLVKDSIDKKRIKHMDIESEEIVELHKKVFGINNINIDQKYIILEEPFRCAGRVIDSDNCFDWIASKVGAENIIVKTHPRNDASYYKDKGIAVFSQPIAWEALLAGVNMDDKVLITCSSTSGINSKRLYKSNCKIIFLYDLVQEAREDLDRGRTREFYDSFVKQFKDEVYAPQSYEELEMLL